MNYARTIEFLYNQLPVYQRDGNSNYKINLYKTLAINNYLGNPDTKFKAIHIAGTNGKGSVSHILASVLQEAGYKTGLYTSPHLKDFRERIRVNGKMIFKKNITAFVKTHENYIEWLRPSFFEITVAMAFNYFAEQQVDIAVIETGLGGRLDSTNIITPLVSVITNIGLDHTEYLGNTLAEIAAEKAEIIKPEVPAVIGETQPDISNVFINKAKKAKSEIYFADQNYSIQKPDCDLKGFYQEKNCITAMQAIEVLVNKCKISISQDNIRAGFRKVRKNTCLMGRWQILHENPLIICDTAHNEEGIREVAKQIQSMNYNTLHLILGIVKEKNAVKMLQHFPASANCYFTKANIARALDEKKLKKEAEKAGLSGSCYAAVAEALEAAKQNATPEDLIFIGGSTFVVAEI